MGHRDDPAGDTHRQDQFWQAHGIEWHLGHTHLPLETDAWMTATDIATHIAHLTNITPRTIHQWHYRGHITTRTAGDGSPRYNVGEVIAYAASRRRKHAG